MVGSLPDREATEPRHIDLDGPNTHQSFER